MNLDDTVPNIAIFHEIDRDDKQKTRPSRGGDLFSSFGVSLRSMRMFGTGKESHQQSFHEVDQLETTYCGSTKGQGR